MIRRHSLRHPGLNRSGKTLVMFALLLPLLLGVVGLSIDSGLLMANYRQTQNVADAAALAAAVDLINGNTVATAQATGTTYAQTYNLASSTVTINIPPLSGPHAGTGNTSYAEAIVSFPYSTSFIQLLGVNKSQSVTARAVAGYHPAMAAGVMALLPSGSGFNISGSGTLKVDGAVYDNATSSTALNASGSATIYATGVYASGGASISGSATIQNYPSGGGTSPLNQNTGVQYADPLVNLALPTTFNGVVNTYYGTLSGSPLTLQTSSSPQALSVSGSQVATLLPGIYKSINISGSSSVTFSPGIYVLAGGGITISGSAVISGSNVMFYNTSTGYNALTGLDILGSFGSINISGSASFNLSGISDSSSPFNSILFFQDRANSSTVSISGSSTSGTLYTGTFYAPAANFSFSGSANYSSSIIVGSITYSGSTSLITPASSPSYSNLVFMVE
jgi:Flp pilus assembly protein TadG